MTLDSIKLKTLNFLLKWTARTGRNLSMYRSKTIAKQRGSVPYRQGNGMPSGQGNGMPYPNKDAFKDRFSHILLKDQDIIDKRVAICNDCEFLVKATGNCKKCGCFIKAKTKVATVACPIGKWDKEYDFMKGRPSNSQPADKNLQTVEK